MKATRRFTGLRRGRGADEVARFTADELGCASRLSPESLLQSERPQMTTADAPAQNQENGEKVSINPTTTIRRQQQKRVLVLRLPHISAFAGRQVDGLGPCSRLQSVQIDTTRYGPTPVASMANKRTSEAGFFYPLGRFIDALKCYLASLPFCAVKVELIKRNLFFF